MYENIAVIAVFALAYACVSQRVERSILSGPIVFIAGGLLLGPMGFGLIDLQIGAETLRILAELTLAMVLFTDAANADLGMVRQTAGLPTRLLLIGLPLTIVLGIGLALPLFPGLGIAVLALLAATLAPTDAALGKPVVTNPAVPKRLRESLNLESGLNDGICVPIILILLGIATGTDIEGRPLHHVLAVVVEEIGIGLVTGAVLTAAASFALRAAMARAWLTESWFSIAVVALAVGCFAAAQALGGSGFIACYIGGMTFNALRPPEKHALLRGAEGTGDALSFATWVVFGSAVVGQLADRLTLPILVYAVLSLTMVRMLPVFLCLSGSSISTSDKLFVGWFGPRGLASVVFAIIILDANVPGFETIGVAIATTIVLSVLLHGLSANPIIGAFSERWRRVDPMRE
jgi:NhaP-type Na+/H+ or K+/H+ antiporter